MRADHIGDVRTAIEQHDHLPVHVMERVAPFGIVIRFGIKRRRCINANSAAHAAQHSRISCIVSFNRQTQRQVLARKR
jgi:hypothetical protein